MSKNFLMDYAQISASSSRGGLCLWTPAEREAISKRVKVKLDCILLPMVNHPRYQATHVLKYFQLWFIYFLSYLDKQTLNYANAYGLRADLGLVGRDYSWVASITNIASAISSVPTPPCSFSRNSQLRNSSRET
jgi:hypothetical protein